MGKIFNDLTTAQQNAINSGITSALVNSFIKLTTFEASTSCNNITETGLYKCGQWTNVPSEAPDGQGILVVYGWIGSQYCRQEYYSPNNKEKWIRTLINSVWSDWEKVITNRKETITQSVTIDANNKDRVSITIPTHNYTHFQVTDTSNSDWVSCEVVNFGTNYVKVLVHNYYNASITGNIKLVGYY